jgi:hypothetical protein
MGWDYVSELRPRAGLLFIPQVVYEHAESGCNDTTGENVWLVHHSSLEIQQVESSSSKAAVTGEAKDEFGQSIFSHFEGMFTMP